MVLIISPKKIIQSVWYESFQKKIVVPSCVDMESEKIFGCHLVSRWSQKKFWGFILCRDGVKKNFWVSSCVEMSSKKILWCHLVSRWVQKKFCGVILCLYAFMVFCYGLQIRKLCSVCFFCVC